MVDSELPARRYSDEEIARILKRATEMHPESPTTSAAGTGLTLDELQQVAAEAGIDPKLVRRAALEVDTYEETPSPLMSKFAGASPSIVLERVVPGEISDAAFETLLAEIQRSAGTHGQPSLLGRTLTWQSDTPTRSRSTQVTVTSRDGETRIRIEERLHQLVGQLFGGLMGGVGVGMGAGVGVGVGLEVLGSALAAVAIPVAVLGVTYGTARAVFGRLAGSRRRALERMLERLTELASAATLPGLEPPGEPVPPTDG